MPKLCFLFLTVDCFSVRHVFVLYTTATSGQVRVRKLCEIWYRSQEKKAHRHTRLIHPPLVYLDSSRILLMVEMLSVYLLSKLCVAVCVLLLSQ